MDGRQTTTNWLQFCAEIVDCRLLFLLSVGGYGESRKEECVQRQSLKFPGSFVKCGSGRGREVIASMQLRVKGCYRSISRLGCEVMCSVIARHQSESWLATHHFRQRASVQRTSSCGDDVDPSL